MTTTIAVLLALLAGGPDESLRRWSAGDTALQATFVLITAVDWAQTRWSPFGLAPDGKVWEEENPLLGRFPSKTKIDLCIGGAVLAHTAVAILLPKPYRTLWQLTWIAVEGGTVYRNHFAGVRIRW